jgi:ribose-phosphate pyrophosphokinase
MKSPFTKGEKMEKIKIFSGRSHPKIAEEICRRLNIKLSQKEPREYANGCFEVILQEEVKDCKVFLIQTSIPQTLHHDLWELLQMVNAAKENGASEIIVVMPYVSYARSDKIYTPGMTIAIELLVKLLETSGMTRFIGFDFHSSTLENSFSSQTKAHHLSAVPLFAEYLKTKDLTNSFILPGGERYFGKASLLAKMINRPCGVVKTKRISDNKAVIKKIIGEVSGKDIIIVDDEISNAGTKKAFGEKLQELSVKTLTIAATHGLFVGKAIGNLQSLKILKEIIVTDTVPIPEEVRKALPLQVLSVAGLIAEKIKEISKEP